MMRATRLKYRAFSVVSLEAGGSGVLSVPHSRLETAIRSRAALDKLVVSEGALERWATPETTQIQRRLHDWALLAISAISVESRVMNSMSS
jgi:hypothetical protein